MECWHTLFIRYRNESGIGITSLEWYPDTEESERDGKAGLYFADNEGYIGWFQGAEPTAGGRGSAKGAESTDDPLADDSLLMEGIPPDAIFVTDDIMDGDDEVLDGAHDDEGETALSGSHSNPAEDDDIIHSRKRRRLLEDSDEGETESNAAGGGYILYMFQERKLMN